MTPNSRIIAFVLATIISSSSSLIIFLHPDSEYGIVLLVGVSTFLVSFILIRITIEYLFYREINNIYHALRQIQDKDLSFLANQKKTSINPLRRISKEIFTYAGQKQLEIDELKKMEAFRREFIADVSHELKTPIFAAQGFVHTLIDGAVEDENVRMKFLKKAAKSLDGLDALVHDLLTISQVETGALKMKLESFDLVSLAKEVIGQLEVTAKEREIELRLEHDPDALLFVRADQQRIYQVLLNLLSNGIKYTHKGGLVILSIKQKNEKIVTKVRDNGKGIPEEDLGRIFERFYRVDKSRSKDSGGTGLGLSIAKHILEAHNSKIYVKSKLKKGSVFWFKLEAANPSM